MKKNKMMVIRISDDELLAFGKIAKKNNSTMSEIIRNLIQYLEANPKWYGKIFRKLIM